VFALSKCSAKPFGVLAPPCMRYSLHNFDNLRAALLQSWPKAPHQFRQIAMVEYGECTGDVARGVRGRCRLTVVVVRVTAGSQNLELSARLRGHGAAGQVPRAGQKPRNSIVRRLSTRRTSLRHRVKPSSQSQGCSCSQVECGRNEGPRRTGAGQVSAVLAVPSDAPVRPYGRRCCCGVGLLKEKAARVEYLSVPVWSRTSWATPASRRWPRALKASCPCCCSGANALCGTGRNVRHVRLTGLPRP